MQCMETYLLRLNRLFHRFIFINDNKTSYKSINFDLQRFAEGGEKTEEPTEKRRRDAKAKGQVARSQELNTAFVLLVGFFLVKILWEYIYTNIAEYTIYIYSHLAQSTSVESIREIFLGIMLLLAKTAFPIMVSILIIGLAINIYQVGLMFNLERLSFNLNKLNPINGFGRIFSKRSLVELVKSLFKIAIIGSFLYLYLKDQIPFMPYFIYFDLAKSLEEIAKVIFNMVFQVIAIIIIMAIADYSYQKWQTTQDLKMTKQEVKDEYKQMEGDPQIKGKIKQKQRQMAMMRMMQEVPKADVIITNPTHLAIALMYKSGMVAPLVVAKGQDVVAERIKQIARENKVTIVENKPLARALYTSVQVGDMVPHELYQAVAEVLAYVYRLKNRKTAPQPSAA
ncbi:MAG: flagellar biosynthesis protein FlhB [Selenomonadaceae bacterium]|nr:flagellar biosynthesis protein FlhB [Selenomonadaceae bacterium]MBR1858326.1 flagellar biosynthesis protein FlhB [Selenomonadaceae bacterium]